MSGFTQNDVYYLPGGAPFFFRGNDEVGCLCLHGLQAVPQEVLWLGKYLAGQGYTVYGPRIAGHGTDITQLRQTHWENWYGSALDGYTILRQQCRKVFVIGLSMGGTLALHLGTRERPDGVAALAAPLGFDQTMLPYARYLKLVWRYTAKHLDENFTRIDTRMRQIQAAQGEPEIGRAAYGHFPVASLAELYEMMGIVKARLPHLTMPLQLVYSEGDRTVPFWNLDAVQSGVGTPPEHVRVQRLTRSDHLLTLDEEMDTVFETVASFVAHYAAEPVRAG
jgi:carboxylesterase